MKILLLLALSLSSAAAWEFPQIAVNESFFRDLVRDPRLFDAGGLQSCLIVEGTVKVLSVKRSSPNSVFSPYQIAGVLKVDRVLHSPGQPIPDEGIRFVRSGGEAISHVPLWDEVLETKMDGAKVLVTAALDRDQKWEVERVFLPSEVREDDLRQLIALANGQWEKDVSARIGQLDFEKEPIIAAHALYRMVNAPAAAPAQIAALQRAFESKDEKIRACAMRLTLDSVRMQRVENAELHEAAVPWMIAALDLGRGPDTSMTLVLLKDAVEKGFAGHPTWKTALVKKVRAQYEAIRETNGQEADALLLTLDLPPAGPQPESKAR